jgi:hypothetical protein
MPLSAKPHTHGHIVSKPASSARRTVLDGVVHDGQRRDERQADERGAEAPRFRLRERLFRSADCGVDNHERRRDGGKQLEGGRLCRNARDLREDKEGRMRRGVQTRVRAVRMRRARTCMGLCC